MEATKIPEKNRGGRPAGLRSSQPSDAVSRVRASLGLTQEEFARELGCSLSNVAKMEGEKRTPGTRALKDNLVRLAKRAGLNIDEEVAA
ncbi:MAG: XRE family transcriptional regulator [Proteobacteria bacterium]|nr:MAG: XRE family transcriptional regulator [Pseudomonadota bacterium]